MYKVTNSTITLKDTGPKDIILFQESLTLYISLFLAVF